MKPVDLSNSYLLRQFYGLTIAGGLTLAFTAPLTAVLALRLGASPFAASLSVASLNAVVLILDVFGTRLLPFLNPRHAMTGGMLLWSVGSFGTAVAPSFEVMTAARMVQGGGLAFYAAAAPQLAVRLGGANRVGTAIGRFQAAMTLGSAIGPLSGGAVAAVGTGTFGPRLAFVVCGVMALVCAGGAWLSMPSLSSPVRPRISLPYLPGMAHPRALWALWMGSAGQGARGAIALAVVPLIAAEEIGLSGPLIGIFLTVMYLIEVVAMAGMGAWSDRWGRRPGLLAGTAGGIVGVAVLGLATATGSVMVFFVAAVPLGLAGGCMLGLLPAVLVDLAEGPGVGLAATRLSRDLGFTCCTLLAGAAMSLSGPLAALVLCAGLFASVIIVSLAIGETRLEPATIVP